MRPTIVSGRMEGLQKTGSALAGWSVWRLGRPPANLPVVHCRIRLRRVNRRPNLTRQREEDIAFHDSVCFER